MSFCGLTYLLPLKEEQKMKNVFQERKEKCRQKVKITLTDINGLTAYLISSHQRLLSSCSTRGIGDVAGQGRTARKSATISSTYYTGMTIIEILHPSERSKGQEKNKNLPDTDTSTLVLHMHELRFKRKEAKSSALFFLFHFIIFKC